jgi:hypothetical protein
MGVIGTETQNTKYKLLKPKKMKNLINAFTFIFAVSILTATTLSAKTPPAINSDQDLEKAIKTVVDFPTIEETDAVSTTVNVLFKVDFDGNVKVVETNGCDKYSKKVIKSLEILNITAEKMQGRYFKKTITFELIK